jgi:hypothetical protein
LGHVSDMRVKTTSLLAGLAPAGSATTRAITKIAGTKASRLIENLLSLPNRVIHPRYQCLSTAKSRRSALTPEETKLCGRETWSILHAVWNTISGLLFHYRHAVHFGGGIKRIGGWG